MSSFRVVTFNPNARLFDNYADAEAYAKKCALDGYRGVRPNSVEVVEVFSKVTAGLPAVVVEPA